MTGSGHAVQLAERVWWVGHHRPGDELQCHVYLIEQGDQSLLIDPGSQLTFNETLGKIEEIIPFDSIRWFVCHHQDPDVIGSLQMIDRRVVRDDACIVSHWRAEGLIKHLGISMPFWLVEEHEWQLQLVDRLLKFVFTPYAHLPGAFCTFDCRTRVLFSSDLFGGFSQTEALFAEDEGYFEAMRPFHEHNIPSRDVLCHALAQIEQHPVEMIAPQHGAVIPQRLVGYLSRRLKDLECGLHLMAQDSNDFHRLSRLNAILKEITSTMVVSRDFREIAERLRRVLAQLLPVGALEFYVQLEDDTVLFLAAESRYRGVAASPPSTISRLFGVNRDQWRISKSQLYRLAPDAAGGSLLLPLFRGDDEWMYGVVVIRLTHPVDIDEDITRMLEQMSGVLQVAVERETIFRRIELERQKFYERSIRDPLTGLFTRFYMDDSLRRLFEIHDRNGGAPLAMAMIDIDHFKRVNDRYGHLRGDQVLREVAQLIDADARASDLPVRLGGEEFCIIVVGASSSEIPAIAERLRKRVEAARFQGALADLRVTISIGTAIRQPGETIPGFMERADLALYRAKGHGRNRVCFADRAGYSNQWILDLQ